MCKRCFRNIVQQFSRMFRWNKNMWISLLRHYQDNNTSCATLDISLTEKNHSCTTLLKEFLLRSFWHLSGKKKHSCRTLLKESLLHSFWHLSGKKNSCTTLLKESLLHSFGHISSKQQNLAQPSCKKNQSLLHIALVAKILWDQNLLYTFPFLHLWH